MTQSVDLPENDEAELWTKRSATFCSEQGLTEQEKRKQMQELKVAEPRRASANWLQVVEHALLGGTGSGFERFDNVAAIKNLNLPRKIGEPSPNEKCVCGQ